MDLACLADSNRQLLSSVKALRLAQEGKPEGGQTKRSKSKEAATVRFGEPDIAVSRL